MKHQTVNSSIGVHTLANTLLNSGRKKPICVLTLPFDSSHPAVSLDSFEEAEGACDFYLVETSDLTRELAALLPERSGVYNGAIRVYPSGFSDETPAYSLPIFQPSTNKAKLAEDVLAEIWSRADLSELKTSQLKRAKAASGKITAFFPARAWVKLDGGGQATIRQEVSFPGVPLEWLYKLGDKVAGRFDATDGAFIPDSTERTLADLVGHFGLGHVTLALVAEAGRQIGKVKLLPNVEVEITRDEITGNDRDLVQDLLEPGEVVAVRLYKNEQGKLRVRMDDIDDDEVVLPALALVPGGEPWLFEGRDVPVYEQEVEVPTPAPAEEFVPLRNLLEEPQDASPQTSSIPMPGPGKLPGMPGTPGSPPAPASAPKRDHTAEFVAKQYRSQLDEANAKIKQLTAQVNANYTKWMQAEEDLRALRGATSASARKSEKKARRTEARVDRRSTTWDRRNRWDNDLEWFNDELRRAWISRYAASDRRTKYVFDESKFSFGDRFFASLKAVANDDESIRKVVRVIVDIATGREDDARAHEVHPLREGLDSRPDPVTRPDGAECHRAYVEQNSPAARRVHFWKLGRGNFEFSRVVTHDDYKP